MFENYDEMEALAKEAKERLQQQVDENTNEEVNVDEEEGDDLYAEFREEEEFESTFDNDASEYVNQDGEQEEVDVYYGPLPELDNDGDSEELPSLKAYDEPLFPGGPGKIQVQSWKKEWEGYDIFVTEILNEMFVFRTLNRFEYKQLIALQNLDALQREEVICQTVTLWPSGYEWKTMATDKAGIPSTLSNIIMEKSGFTKDYAIQVI